MRWPRHLARLTVLSLFVTVMLGCMQPGRLVVEVVEVDGDATLALSAVSLRVGRPATREDERELREFVLADTPLPLRFGVEPVGGTGLVRVDVIGFRTGAPVVESTATVNIVRGPTRVLRMYLDARCEGILDCADDETCVGGVCEPVRIIEPEELPTLGTDVDAIVDAAALDAPAEVDVAPIDGGGACPSGMIFIPADTFTMGSPRGAGEANEEPPHDVSLSAYCLDTTEVSAGAYAVCVTSGACAPPGTGAEATGGSSALVDHPINYVSWIDANTYCTWRGARLPTEAEWEHAARPDGRTYPWGDNVPSADLLNACGAECPGGGVFPYTDPYVSTAPVGSFPDGASPYGVLDMAGNVWEWVGDWYHSNYYSVSPATDPSGPSSSGVRVRRGGSYISNTPNFVRSAIRQYDDPAFRNARIGFRCARGP